MTRVLALDYGEKRIGASVSDPLGHIAFGAGVIENKGLEFVSGRIKEILDKYGDVGEILVGMPLRLKGGKGVQAEKVEVFISSLKESMSIPVIAFDERLTTVEAARRLREAGICGKKAKGLIDETSAMSILQGYLDSKNDQKKIR